MFGFLKKNKEDDSLLIKRKQSVELVIKKKTNQDILASVVVCLDKSGSMYDLYKNGTVQETLDRLLPISLQMDDDGVVPVYQFNNYVSKSDDLTISNIDGYVYEKLDSPRGGTSYAPCINKMIEDFKSGSRTTPVFVIFITDGENNDRYETEKALIKASSYPIYFQFVGIGDEYFEFLQDLDNLKGREFDNAGFISIRELNKISDDDLYDKLLDEFINIYNDVR